MRIISATHRNLAEQVNGGPLPPGPLLPAERDRAEDAAAARDARGHPGASREASSSASRARTATPPRLRGRRARGARGATTSRATCASSRTSSSARSRFAAGDEIARRGPAARTRARAPASRWRSGGAGGLPLQEYLDADRAQGDPRGARQTALQPHRGREAPRHHVPRAALPHGAARHHRRESLTRPIRTSARRAPKSASSYCTRSACRRASSAATPSSVSSPTVSIPPRIRISAEIHGLRVSAHFLIRRDGELVQFVPVERAPGTPALSTWRGRSRCNDFSIGIELEGTDDAPFEDAPVRASRTNCSRGCGELCRCGRSPGTPTSRPGRKTDPGPCFDWRRLLLDLGTAAS